jgi:hypothetical protein
MKHYVQLLYNHVLQQNIPAILKHFNVLLFETSDKTYLYERGRGRNMCSGFDTQYISFIHLKAYIERNELNTQLLLCILSIKCYP